MRDDDDFGDVGDERICFVDEALSKQEESTTTVCNKKNYFIFYLFIYIPLLF